MKSFWQELQVRLSGATDQIHETDSADFSTSEQQLVNIEEFHRDIAPRLQDYPEFYHREVVPLLDSWKARYGDCVPASELNELFRRVDNELNRLFGRMQAWIQQAADDGKAVEISALRLDLEKWKTEYQGPGRDGHASGIDEWLASLERKYGASIPPAEAVAILAELDSRMETTAKGSALDWSVQPGFHERRLRVRYDNPFLPAERRGVSHDELSRAKAEDAKGLALLEEAVRSTGMLAGLENATIADISGLVREAEETISHCRDFGPCAVHLAQELEAFTDALVNAIPDDNVRQGLRKYVQECRILTATMRPILLIGKVAESDEMPMLLNLDLDDLRLLYLDFPPDCAKAAASNRGIRARLREFTAQLIHDSPEARARILQEPEKLALIGEGQVSLILAMAWNKRALRRRAAKLEEESPDPQAPDYRERLAAMEQAKREHQALSNVLKAKMERDASIRTRRERDVVDSLLTRAYHPACEWDRAHEIQLMVLATKPDESKWPFKVRNRLHILCHALFGRC